MANEKGRNKNKREQKKIKRLELLLDINLCACGSGHKLRCHGICKKTHTNSKTGKIKCGEVYQIDISVIKQSGSRRPKRTWKYGHQKDVNENKQAKQQRREKLERDRLR